ncbi:MAG: MlaD family protein [Nitrospinota bacterium]|jgi:phospholipid/cholesterol/gamma-HCH transport system substrate-binding protein
MGGLKTEVKVGIFVLLGIIFLTYMTINIEKIQIGKERGYNVYVILDSAQGLVKNTAVKTAGVGIGRIVNISLTEKKARLTVNLPHHVKLRRDAKASVKMESLLGEKFLEIDPGSQEAAVLKPGGEIQQGAPPPDMDRLIVQLNSIASDIKSVTQPLSEVLGGKEGKESIKDIVDNIKEASSGFNKIIKDNDEKIGRIITSVDKFSNDLPTLSQDAREMVASLNNITKKIETGEGTLGKLIKSDEAYNQIMNTFSSVRTTFTNVNNVLNNLNKIAKDVRSGKGSLGKLMTNDSLYEQAKSTVESLNKIAKKVEKGEGTLGKIVNDETLYTEAKKALKGITKSTEGIQEQIPITTLGIVIGTVVQ